MWNFKFTIPIKISCLVSKIERAASEWNIDKTTKIKFAAEAYTV